MFQDVVSVKGDRPLSREFSRQEYWSGLPLPSPADLPAAAAKSLQLCPTCATP